MFISIGFLSENTSNLVRMCKKSAGDNIWDIVYNQICQKLCHLRYCFPICLRSNLRVEKLISSFIAAHGRAGRFIARSFMFLLNDSIKLHMLLFSGPTNPGPKGPPGDYSLFLVRCMWLSVFVDLSVSSLSYCNHLNLFFHLSESNLFLTPSRAFAFERFLSTQHDWAATSIDFQVTFCAAKSDKGPIYIRLRWFII